MTGRENRLLLVDASVFITLAAIETVDLLDGLTGSLVIPWAVADEITDDPAVSALADAEQDSRIERTRPSKTDAVETASRNLGVADPDKYERGDAPLSASLLRRAERLIDEAA